MNTFKYKHQYTYNIKEIFIFLVDFNEYRK